MLKREITYENLDGEEITEVFYFNISKPELVELEVEHEAGFQAWIKRIGETNDRKTLIAEFKRIILLAYGEKSADGKRFVKNDQLREEFEQTPAYEKLFYELLTEEDYAAEFIKGVLPKDISEGIDSSEVTPMAPTPPTAPSQTS